MPARLLAIAVLLLALPLTGCGGDDEAGSDTPVAIGSKNFTESVILGELYKQALEAKGFNVTLKSSVGSTEIIDKALTSGQIDFYPEYTGTMLTVVFAEQESPGSAEETYERAKELQEERGFTLFEQTPFSDSDALAVTKETADEKNLASIGDLAGIGRFKLGGQPEFETRLQGLVGLKERYGISDVEFVPFAGISPYEALAARRSPPASTLCSRIRRRTSASRTWRRWFGRSSRRSSATTFGTRSTPSARS